MDEVYESSSCFKYVFACCSNTGCRYVFDVLGCLYQLSENSIVGAIPWSEYPSWAASHLMDIPTRAEIMGVKAVVDGKSNFSFSLR